MKRSILSRYRVDKVPILIRPQFYLYGYGLGLLLFFILLFLRVTTKVKISGHEKLREDSNHIFCLWHSFVPLALISATPLIPAALDRASQAWMQHPVWYMKPIHVLLRLMGVKKIILGSTGHSGRDAAELKSALAARGILVRHFGTSRLNDFIRISIGRPEQNDQLLRVLREME